VHIAECAFRSHDYAQAIAEYTAVLERSATGDVAFRARFQIANSYALLEQYADAITIYEDLLRTPESLSLQFNLEIKLELAFCYSQQEDYAQAVALYEELEDAAQSEVTLDTELIARRKERILERLAELNRAPQEVDWKRR
jgi:tetratricopeptide (TPR) repeat protein